MCNDRGKTIWREYLLQVGYGGIGEVAAFLANDIVRARPQRVCAAEISMVQNTNSSIGVVGGLLCHHVRPRVHPQPEPKVAAGARIHRLL